MSFILLALLNGVLIALTRSLNGKLAVTHSAFYASWINHIVGFAALTLVTLTFVGRPTHMDTVPAVLYLGGIIGALYVTLNAYVVPHLGLTVATLCVIAGQMVTSVVIDAVLGDLAWQEFTPILALFLGCGLIVFGFYQLLKAP